MKNLKLLFLCILLTGMQIAYGQVKTISGTVTSSEDGTSIPGVSVHVKGTTVGSITNIDGYFQLQVPEDAEVLTFSFVGLKTIDIPISGSIVNVTMAPDILGLDEVMVVAYGTSAKGAYTGSAVQVNSEEIELRPLSNITTAVEGSAPGVMVTAADGQPGSSQSIRVRGFGSYSASSSPLIVVDNVPFSGELSAINPNDIESFTILKDAASTSLYGNKAANGVIMITTKRGKMGKGQLSVNASYGIIDRAQPEYEKVSPQQYYELMWESYRNEIAIPGVDPDADVTAASLEASQNIYDELGYNPFTVASDAIVGTDGKINPNAVLKGDYANDLDWVDAVTRIGSRQNYDVNYQGATEKTDYYVSMGYLKEDGYIIKSDLERFSGRTNVNFKANDWFKTGFNLSASTAKTNNSPTGTSTAFVNPIRFSRNIGSIYPVHMIDETTGNYILDDYGNLQYDINDNRPGGASSGRHIIAELNWNVDERTTTSLNAKTYAEFTILKDFKLTTNGSIDQRNYYRESYQNEKIGDGAPGGRASRTYTKGTSVNFNQILNYQKSFGSHNVAALAAHESYKYTYNYFYGGRTQQIADLNTELVNFVTTTDLTSYTDTYSTESYFGRLNYDYDSKYFVSASYRKDGSSKFAKDVRWGDFWSIGASWRLDQEQFMSSVSEINMLKLRASYGEVGNDAGISYWAYQALYALDYNNQAEPGVIQSKLEASDLLWESSNSYDLAVEFAAFSKLSGSVEFYHRISDNLLFDVPLPLSSGFESQSKNIGAMYNQGIEISLAYDIINNNSFKWDINANLSTLKNEFTKLPGGTDDEPAEIINGSKKLMVGRSIYDYWLREWYGVDSDDGSALYYADDTEASSVRVIEGDTLTTDINNAKYNYVGTAIPDFFGSVTNNFSYKNFSLSFMFTYQVGGKVLDYNYQSVMGAGSYGSGKTVDILNRWQEPGDVTNVPRMDAGATSNFDATSSRWLTDASFLNLRNISLAYDLPESVLDLAGFSSARVYLSGENVWLLNARKGMNVQQEFSGTTSNVYTPSRVITLGVNVKF